MTPGGRSWSASALPCLPASATMRKARENNPAITTSSRFANKSTLPSIFGFQRTGWSLTTSLRAQTSLEICGRTPESAARWWAWLDFEPATSSLSGMRSNQLSYTPSPRKTFSAKTLLRRNGGADRARTDDLLNANQALSHLSYSPGTDSRLNVLNGRNEADWTRETELRPVSNQSISDSDQESVGTAGIRCHLQGPKAQRHWIQSLS